ncbi:toll/interleukin-1 receptor domain-containing protein [Ferrimonas pelagia]|uniref:TIR domain-containing protein n=1 Tax=Ferrimonas pelagia TaxID=1177826 RepID=A0ABP9FDV8_9GAMM
MRLFLSHSSQDHQVAAGLVAQLKALGHSVWFAPAKIQAGHCFASEISAAMREVEAFLLLASGRAIGSGHQLGSEEVKTELKMARERRIPVIPLKVDASLDGGGAQGFDYLLKNYQWLDLQPMLSVSHFADMALLIDAALNVRGNTANLPIESLIAQAEQRLRDKDWRRASALLEALAVPVERTGQHKLLLLIAKLQSQPIKRLTKSKADAIIAQLEGLSLGAEAAPGLYLQALLSEGFYRAQAIADPTPGFDALKHAAQGQGRLKAKYVTMTDTMLRNSTAFVTQWRY